MGGDKLYGSLGSWPNQSTCHGAVGQMRRSGACDTVRFGLRIQPVDATHALKRSAGVSKPNVFLGRSFN
jgi:hypothetical protein